MGPSPNRSWVPRRLIADLQTSCSSSGMSREAEVAVIASAGESLQLPSDVDDACDGSDRVKGGDGGELEAGVDLNLELVRTFIRNVSIA